MFINAAIFVSQSKQGSLHANICKQPHKARCKRLFHGTDTKFQHASPDQEWERRRIQMERQLCFIFSSMRQWPTKGLTTSGQERNRAEYARKEKPKKIAGQCETSRQDVRFAPLETKAWKQRKICCNTWTRIGNEYREMMKHGKNTAS